MDSLVSPRRVNSMIELTQDVVDHGASVAAGGERLFGETGSFWAPTVLINVPLEAKVFNEEPFGRRACGG